MDVVQAINERFAVRAYKPDPVPLDLMKKILQQALRAPSWANTQPWEFAVATGQTAQGDRGRLCGEGNTATTTGYRPPLRIPRAIYDPHPHPRR